MGGWERAEAAPHTPCQCALPPWACLAGGKVFPPPQRPHLTLPYPQRRPQVPGTSLPFLGDPEGGR